MPDRTRRLVAGVELNAYPYDLKIKALANLVNSGNQQLVKLAALYAA
jgi:hypothetical protein